MSADKIKSFAESINLSFSTGERLAAIAKLNEAADELESELSASQAREAELTKQRDECLAITAECRDACGDWQDHPEAMGDPNEVPAVVKRLRERADAAEAIIKASQEQKPVAYVCSVMINGEMRYGVLLSACTGSNVIDAKPLYTQPPIPPELAELQRELADTKQSRDYYIQSAENFKREAEELSKLLESKVPEGWQLVPKMPTAEMLVVMANWEDGHASKLAAYQELIAAAPQPKEPKQ